MNITNICVYAEAYYSGETYEENIQITTESYEKLKEDIDSIVCYIPELDGKHSEVEADTTTESFTEEEILNTTWDTACDGDSLKYKLKRIFNEHELDFDKEIQIVKDYLNSLDTFVEITVTVRKSNVDKVNEFCENL